ncbi:MAG: N-formylglutamate amidohydrolase [Alphaproteobacteria bacterium]|nr:N-formylglutamate amidohydrolase [Alphaproteobacteria bacterium]
MRSSAVHRLQGVLVREAPATESVPAVFDSPHSGDAYPADFDHALEPDVLARAEDRFVHELFETVPRHGGVLLYALFPRSYIDVNRHSSDIDERLLDEPWPEAVEPSEKTRQGVGLLRRLAPGRRALYRRKLSVAEVQARIRDYYEPYHATLAEALADLHRRFGAVWHLNCHSMQSHGDGRRADFVLSDRLGASCERAFVDRIADYLSGAGFRVAVNDPYVGAEILRRYGRPEDRRHSLQIEIKRSLYMDERSLAKHAGFAHLARVLDGLIACVCAHARESGS